jgi:hypothetical protein
MLRLAVDCPVGLQRPMCGLLLLSACPHGAGSVSVQLTMQAVHSMVEFSGERS